MNKNQEKIALGVLVILHTVGLFGLNSNNYVGEFKSLIWVNLLFIFAIILSLHPKWNIKYVSWVPLAFLIGMTVEIIGVRTGKPFGAYHYTDLLGTQFMGVPLIIGMNWVIVAYCAGMVSNRVDPAFPIRVFSGALIMTLMDVLIEPFAIRYDMWQWDAGSPPFQNYLGWFGAGLLIMALYHRMIRAAYNPVAAYTLLVLALFFGLDLLINLF